jgi:DNA repair protein RecN (Recombination protein N)
MIRQIVLQNIAIADSLSVDFGPGLNVVTGETGAGKSILVDALALLRGARVETGLIRTGHDSAMVSGVFVLHPTSPVRALLTQQGIPLDSDSPDELVLRRTLLRSGRHRAFVNDAPVSARTLQIVAEELIDISSQFENQKLLDVRTHTKYLDAFCGALELSKEVESFFEEAGARLAKVRQLEAEREKRLREKDLYEFERSEIASANPDSAEFQEVESLLQTARQANTVATLSHEILGLLSDSDTSCFSLIQLARKNIEKLSKITEKAGHDVSPKVLGEAVAALDAMVDDVRAVQRAYFVDEERLVWANERIEIYNKLLRKFGPDVDAVLRHRDKCEAFLSDVVNIDVEIDEAARDAARVIQALVKAAQKLSRVRREATAALSQKVQRELAELGMPKSRFACEFQEPTARRGDLFPERVRALLSSQDTQLFLKLGSSGAEEARFLLSANAGIDLQSIEKVASGGELSRVMLAIKTILFENESVNLFVFDEIDVGISGHVAAKVGRKLAQFCGDRQAICITHLPQVACYARSHFVAKKFSKMGKTVANISLLENTERARELAGMLSGEKMTPEGLAQAQALLAEAREMRAPAG